MREMLTFWAAVCCGVQWLEFTKNRPERQRGNERTYLVWERHEGRETSEQTKVNSVLSYFLLYTFNKLILSGGYREKNLAFKKPSSRAYKDTCLAFADVTINWLSNSVTNVTLRI